MKKLRPVLAALCVTIMISFCGGRNYREFIKIPEQKFYMGQYLEAARMLLPEVNSSGKDQLLFMMEAGYMLHAGGDYKNSNKILIDAADIAKVKPVSVSQQVGSLLLNERSTNYRGEDFEKVLVHMYVGINFLMMKKYDKARVSFQAVNEQLSKIKTESGEVKYKQNIMAKYLTAAAYEIIGDNENDQDDLEFAYIEYKQILELEPNLQMVHYDLQRLAKKLNYMDDYQDWVRKFNKQYPILTNSGELFLIFQAGQGAIKVSRGSLLGDSSMKGAILVSLNSPGALAAGVSVTAVLAILHNCENPIPEFKKRSNRIKNMRIIVNGRQYNTYKLEDISETAVKTLQDDYTRLKTKVAASIAIKAAASVAAGIAAKKIAESSKKLGGVSGLIGLAVGLGTGAALFSSIKADLRCWHTLPDNLQLSRVFLPPGKYKIRLEYVNYNNIVENSKIIDIEIKKGERTFINERTLQ